MILLVNAAYLFRGSFRLACDLPWKSEAFRRHVTWPCRCRCRASSPRASTTRASCRRTPDQGRGYNYVLGELNRDGRWYAFPLMVLLKTPLAVFVLALLGLRSPGPPREYGTLLVPFAVVMLFFSLSVDPQLGIRYVLPALPFLILAAARGAADSGAAGAGWSRCSSPGRRPRRCRITRTSSRTSTS